MCTFGNLDLKVVQEKHPFSEDHDDPQQNSCKAGHQYLRFYHICFHSFIIFSNSYFNIIYITPFLIITLYCTLAFKKSSWICHLSFHSTYWMTMSLIKLLNLWSLEFVIGTREGLLTLLASLFSAGCTSKHLSTCWVTQFKGPTS